jgi:coiled-coil-helix-coiled-coil-helix domain-containing protein 10
MSVLISHIKLTHCFFQFYLHRNHFQQRSSRSRAPAAPARRPMSTARPAPPKPAPPAPAPAAHPPAPMQQQSSGGGMLSGIGSTIVQGMAFGTGSAIAHRAVGAVAESFSGGGNESAPVPEYAQSGQASAAPVSQNDACAMDKSMFYDCLQQNKGEQMACNFLYEQLKSCQQNNQMQFS